MGDLPGPIRPLPGTPAENTEEGVRVGLVTRIIIVLTVILGQLWALTAGLEAYLSGHTGQAWLLAAFSVISFALVVLLLRLEPAPRASRGRAPAGRGPWVGRGARDGRGLPR